MGHSASWQTEQLTFQAVGRSHTYAAPNTLTRIQAHTQTPTLPQHVRNSQRCAVHSDTRTYVQKHMQHLSTDEMFAECTPPCYHMSAQI